MKLYTSYFYQIRFFDRNMIPLSTAMYDPAWYHDHHKSDYIYLDKRGVLNGVRINNLVPGKSCHNLCRGKECTDNPKSCAFLSKYREQLNQIPFDKFIRGLEKLEKQFINKMQVPEIVFVFIFHEKPGVACSERNPVQEWFKEHGYELEEWKK